jgi:N-acetylmuramoyl-L-alanine amidase
MNRRKVITSILAASMCVLAGGYYWKRRWQYIAVHHSAGSFGNISFLQQVHDERQPKDPIKAIPYHYVIGNGNGLGLGEVAHDWRQELGLWGAHLSGANIYRNFAGIGICLIGNYDMQQVPEQQYSSLLRLTKSLMSKYGISANNVAGHGHVKGEQTRCPGKNFPMARFLADVSRS